MPYAEPRRGRDGKVYYRSRYKQPDGKYGTVKGPDGKVARFPTKRTAIKAGQKAEEEADALARRGRWAPAVEREQTFGAYLTVWWEAAEKLAESSTESYGYAFAHLRRGFEDLPLPSIDAAAISAWEADEKAAGASPSSIATYRRILHTILADAMEEGLIPSNPAARRRNRGRRAGRVANRKPEKTVVSMLGALLAAERMSLLSGRDDEFVASVTKTYTGMRWGEIVGLEEEYLRERSIRVEWQLYELSKGTWTRCPPKDDSYRTLDIPAWLYHLNRQLIDSRGTRPPCACHGESYVYCGRGRDAETGGPATARQVADLAGVSTGTVSNVLRHPERVSARTRERVEKAIAELGFAPVGRPAGEAPHWRRSGHMTWIFTPAMTGWYPKKGREARPVPVTAEPWPGIPVRGRNASQRAEGAWEPIHKEATRHLLRHGHRTLMEEVGTPKVLADERMGHIDTSMSAHYTHVTDRMRARLMEDLTGVWEESLDARLKLSPTSAVPALNRLLAERGRD